MLSKTLHREFENHVGRENVFSDRADLPTYSYDAAVLDKVLPGLHASAFGPAVTGRPGYRGQAPG